MGKSQSFVANKLRLLKLSQPVQEAIMNHEISERHGRSLLRLDEFKQQMILHQILAEQLTVKDTEALVNKTLNPEPESTEETVDATDDSLKEATTKAKKANDKAKKAIAHDTRIAVNTIKKSVQMVEQSGIAVKATEEEQDDVYRITIEIPKQ